MLALQVEEFCEHSGCDWVDTRALCVSESREKLQDLSDKIKEESLEYYKIEKDIKYSRDFTYTQINQKIEAVRENFKLLLEYQMFLEIDDSEVKLVISDIKCI